MTSLRESLFRRLRQWRGWLAGHRFTLHPVNQLQRVSTEGGWQASGNDPQFACMTDGYPLRVGWHLLVFELSEERDRKLQPKLYFDFGQGVHEAWSLPLNFVRIKGRRHAAIVLLPRHVVHMRFDPSDTACRFHTGDFRLRNLTRVEAAWRMLRALRDEAMEATLGELLRESWRRLRRPNGRHEFASWLHKSYQRIGGETFTYQRWLELYDDPSGGTVPASSNLLISIVLPVFNTPEIWLQHCLDSVLAQSYPHWELCIADDASTEPRVREILETYSRRDTRIKVAWRQHNGHISAASNTALAMAHGDYVALLDHDDELHPHALAVVVEALQQHPHWRLLYSDEDKIDAEGHRYDPYFKPDWNPDLLYGQNCVSHLGVYSKTLMDEVGGFREGFEGSQDWDLVLRCMERIQPEQIGHIPKVLYHWRAIAGSTALGVSQKSYAHHAGLRALREHFARQGLASEVMEIDGLEGVFRIRHALPNIAPRVSIIVPTRDRVDLLRQCIDSILTRTTYPSYEIVVVDNQSEDPGTLEYFDSLAHHERVRVVPHNQPFNYSRINNDAVRQCQSPLICLLNNDIEVISPDWLEELVSHALRPKVGAVGAMLYYPNDTIQHAGVVTGVHGVAAHLYCGMPRGHHGQMARARLTQSMSAVTGACLLIRREAYLQVGGLDVSLPVAFNDIDFCLRLREQGYVNIWTPFAELYHHESATRGLEDTPEKHKRFEHEVDFMRRRWAEKLEADPVYNPNLTVAGEPFMLAFPPRPWWPSIAESAVPVDEIRTKRRQARTSVG